MSGRSKRRLRPPGLCDVPGCGQAIRFVKVMRYDSAVARKTQRWIAVNMKPAKAADEQAAIAAVFVVADNVGVDVPVADHAAAMERAGLLYVEHRLTCFDPNWRRLNKALTARGVAEDR